MKYPHVFLTLGILLLACTSGDRIAGGKGGSETTNGITACIRHRDGTPSASSIVRLRRADYVGRPLQTAKATLDGADVVTDQLGRFFIGGIVPGTYCIEVNDTVSTAGQGGTLLLTCRVDTADTVNLGTDSLQPYAALAGSVDTGTTAGRQLYAQIRGLERFAYVKADGSFAFNDLPAGYLNVRIVDGTSSLAVCEIANVKTQPGDTVAVNGSGTSAHSEYLYPNTVVTSPVTITRFPFLVRLDASSFDFSQALPGGDDIYFTKANGSPLPFEIEQWNPGTQHAAIWVRIDTISGNSSDQYIIMHWGAPDARSQSDGKAVFDTAQGFAGVWHMNENPVAGADAIKDRTASRFDGTPRGSMTDGNSVPGIIGAALRFDGTDDYIAAGALNLSGNYTLSLWVNTDDLGTARRFIWKEYSYSLWYDAIGGGIRVEQFTDSLVWRGIYQDNFRLLPLDINTWYHLAATYDGDKIRLYVNGVAVDSTETIGVYPHASHEPLSLGGRSGEFVQGIMDEVRIENRARSADWIRMCYNNQKPDDITTNLRR